MSSRKLNISLVNKTSQDKNEDKKINDLLEWNETQYPAH